MLNKATCIDGCTSLSSERHLEQRERTRETKPSLHGDDGDCHEVDEAKPKVVDPPPARQIAQDDNREPGDDEDRDANVHDKHAISKESGSGGTQGYSCLTQS